MRCGLSREGRGEAKNRTAAKFFHACQTSDAGRAWPIADPITGRAPDEGDGEWDKTSEVPEVHGALHWWALSKVVKPHFSRQSWRAPARLRVPAALTPAHPSAMPAPRRAITR